MEIKTYANNGVNYCASNWMQSSQWSPSSPDFCNNFPNWRELLEPLVKQAQEMAIYNQAPGRLFENNGYFEIPDDIYERLSAAQSVLWQAERIDPKSGFAKDDPIIQHPAWQKLDEAIEGINFGLENSSAEDCIAIAEETALILRRSIAADSRKRINQKHHHQVPGNVHFFYKSDAVGLNRLYEKATEINPGETIVDIEWGYFFDGNADALATAVTRDGCSINRMQSVQTLTEYLNDAERSNTLQTIDWPAVKAALLKANAQSMEQHEIDNPLYSALTIVADQQTTSQQIAITAAFNAREQDIACR